MTLNKHVDYHIFSELISNELNDNASYLLVKLGLYPYKNLRLHGLNDNGTYKSVLLFSAIAVMILLIACINFINLSTAQSGKRVKEIGLRKIIGASKLLIKRQIYSEIFVIILLALILAIFLVMLLLPELNMLSGKSLSISIVENSGLLFIMLSLAVVTAIISGTYTAFYLSSFSPVRVLKAANSTGSRKSLVRKILFILQFSFSTVLIISTIVITYQLRYIQKRDLVFDKEHLIYINLLGDSKIQFNTVKNKLLCNPDIDGVTTTGSLPNDANHFAGGLDWVGRPADVRGDMTFVSVDKDYFSTVGIEFLEGETFRSIPNDREFKEFIINEKAIDVLQMDHPVGKWYKMWDRGTGRIIGIVKNIYNASLRQEIRSVFYLQYPYYYNYLLINVKNLYYRFLLQVSVLKRLVFGKFWERKLRILSD